MKLSIIKTIVLSIAALVVFASAALAQKSDEYDKAEVFVGYQYKRADSENYNGITASVTGNFHKYAGAEFEFGYSKGPDTIFGRAADVDYLGGIQIKDNRKNDVKVKPFAHVLAGLNQVQFLGVKYNNFTTVFGAGIDVKVSEKVSVRAFQADYQRLYDVSSGANQVKLSFGVVFK